jgi:hypothetical protein
VTGDGILRSAVISLCGLYRYELRRIWDVSRPIGAFLMWNPSKADAEVDDLTIAKCVGYGRRWGWGGVIVGNVNAYRATDPDDLAAQADPAGPENDVWIARIVEEAKAGIAVAWGGLAAGSERAEGILALLTALGRPAHCIRTTGSGFPAHPSRGAYTDAPLPYRPG